MANGARSKLNPKMIAKILLKAKAYVENCSRDIPVYVLKNMLIQRHK